MMTYHSDNSLVIEHSRVGDSVNHLKRIHKVVQLYSFHLLHNCSMLSRSTIFDPDAYQASWTSSGSGRSAMADLRTTITPGGMASDTNVLRDGPSI